MFNLSKEQIMVFASEYISRNGIAIRDILTFPHISNYLLHALDDSELEWLSYDIQKNPQGLKNFIQSNAGRKAVENFFIQYKQSIQQAMAQPRQVQIAVQQQSQQTPALLVKH